MKNIRKAILQELESTQVTTRIGTGWISGVIGLLLALVTFSIVLCLRYPHILTSPEIRGLLNDDYINLTSQALIVMAFIFSMISLVLREEKALGLSAMVFILISMVLAVTTGTVADTVQQIHFSLDWFILNLLLTGLLFLPLERLFYRIPQASLRDEWREDLFYFFISSILVQSLTYLSLAPSTAITTFISGEEFRQVIASQPVWVQIIEIMFLTDLVQYWVHRLFHKIPFLWRFHSIHHSAKKLDWLAGSRMHLIEIICLRSLTVIPMFTLGYAELAIQIYLLIVYLYSTYIHSNVRFDVEWLKPYIVTPRFHHWHHGVEDEAIDVNFAIHFPVYDRLFATYYMPTGRWPAGYGVGGHPVPVGYIRQFIYPFTKKV